MNIVLTVKQIKNNIFMTKNFKINFKVNILIRFDLNNVEIIG